jgi:hypothetical protein
LKESILGTIAVKHIANAENRRPTINDNGGINKNQIEGTTPKTITTAKTIDEFIRLLVAPHNISPVMTSSIEIGVVIIASNVF